MADEGSSAGLIAQQYGDIVRVVPATQTPRASSPTGARCRPCSGEGSRLSPRVLRVTSRRPARLGCSPWSSRPLRRHRSARSTRCAASASSSSAAARAATASTRSARPSRRSRLISDEELQERVEAGTLKQIKGIGDSSAAIIGQAVRGVLPAYLVSAEEKHGEPLTPRRRRAVCRPPRRPARALQLERRRQPHRGDGARGRRARPGVDGADRPLPPPHHRQRPVSRERLTDQLKRVDAINASLGDAFTLLKGIEVDIHLDGTLDQDDDMLDQLDVVTASIHSKLRQPSFEMTPRMVAAVRNPRTNVLAHCTGPARHRRPRQAAAVAVRRREGLPGVPRERRRGRDQLAARALRPARRAHRAGARPRLPLHHRLRRARARVSST